MIPFKERVDTSTLFKFLTRKGEGDSILVTNGGVARGIYALGEAETGAVCWALPDRIPTGFPGAMLLNNRRAFALVANEYCHVLRMDSDGFSFEWVDNRWMRVPHFGGVSIEQDVEIGRHVCIDRGVMEDTRIRRGVRIDNLVHIAHNCDIGEDTIIVAGSVICGSVTIGRNCYIGANATIRHRLTIGDNVIVGMGSVVTKDIPSGECWMGNPARFYRRSHEVPRP